MNGHDLTRRELLTASLVIGAASVLPGLAMAADAAKPAAPAETTTAGGRLTFHGIDTHHGATIGALRVDLSRLEGSQYKLVKTFETVKNGRSDGPVIQGEELKVGRYELLLHLDDYFAKLGVKLPSPNFLSKVPLRFAVYDAAQRYHIPVLFNPWSYSYYRGS